MPDKDKVTELTTPGGKTSSTPDMPVAGDDPGVDSGQEQVEKQKVNDGGDDGDGEGG